MIPTAIFNKLSLRPRNHLATFYTASSFYGLFTPKTKPIHVSSYLNTSSHRQVKDTQTPQICYTRQWHHYLHHRTQLIRGESMLANYARSWSSTKYETNYGPFRLHLNREFLLLTDDHHWYCARRFMLRVVGRKMVCFVAGFNRMLLWSIESLKQCDEIQQDFYFVEDIHTFLK